MYYPARRLHRLGTAFFSLRKVAVPNVWCCRGMGAQYPASNVHSPLPQSSKYCVIIRGDDLHESDWSAQLGRVMTKEQFCKQVSLYMHVKNDFNPEEDARFRHKQDLCLLAACLCAIPTVFISCCCWDAQKDRESDCKVQAKQRAYALLQTFSKDNISWKLEHETLKRCYIRIDVVPLEKSVRPCTLKVV